MSVSLQLLTPIWGVAGARGQFEEMCIQLIKNEFPTAETVRIANGDGGIDAHVGKLTDREGIDVFQVKYFDRGIDDSQKAQIRDSFRRVRENTDFKTKSWTLCLPVNLSIPEKKWYEAWVSDQAAAGITINPIWDAARIEGLLMREENKGIRETFFRQEHLDLVRQSNVYLQQIAERTPKHELLTLHAKIVRVSFAGLDANADREGIVRVRLNFEVKNSSKKAAKEWDVTFELIPPHDSLQDCYSIQPGTHSRETILPTAIGRKVVEFGYRIVRRPPPQMQLADGLYKTMIRFQTISEDGVGEPQTQVLSEVLEDTHGFCDMVMRSVKNKLPW